MPLRTLDISDDIVTERYLVLTELYNDKIKEKNDNWGKAGKVVFLVCKILFSNRYFLNLF